MNKTITFFAKDLDKKMRLDKYLTKNLKTFTRSQIKKIILSKNIKLNKKLIVSPSEKINKNDFIEVNIPEQKTDDIKPKKMKIDVVYEDKEMVVINKPSGLVVHPGAGNKDETLVNGLLHLYKNNLSNLNGEFRPGIVHRID